jgi:glycosyltransferase involved in cell wall biosynthesis
MRILSIINYPYFRPGGGLVTMRALYQQLAQRGHRVVAVHTHATYSPITGGDHGSPEDAGELLARPGVRATAAVGGALCFRDGAVEVHHLERAAALGAHLDELLPELAPDYVQLAAHAADAVAEAVYARVPAARVLATCHASEGLPFGPRALHRGLRTLDHLRAARAVWVPSAYVQRYLAEHAGVASTVLPIDVYGPRPAPALGRWDRGAVTLINSSVPKGLPIFAGLARALPSVPFATVPTWELGAAPGDALAGLPANVAVIPPVPHDQIDRIYGGARVLLAPSLLHEAFGLVVVEAMLRGIPVLAADVGGLPEAKLGVPYLLPVSPIAWDRAVGAWGVPPQELGPWREALAGLLADRDAYEQLAARSRAAAQAFVAAIPADGFEQLVGGLGAPAPPAHGR